MTSRPGFAMVVPTVWLLLSAGGCHSERLPAAPSPVAAHIAFVAGAGQSGTVGSELGTLLTVRVTATDGGPVPGVPLVWAASSQGAVSGDATSDVAGEATAHWTLGQTAGVQEISVHVDGSSTLGDSLSARALSGSVAAIRVLSGDGQTTTVATAVPKPPTVRITDSYGNTVSGATVQWVPDTASGVTNVVADTTDSLGTGTVTWTLGQHAGTQRLVGKAGGLLVVGFSATALAGGPASLTILSGGGLAAPIGKGVPIAARLTDQYGNPLKGLLITASGNGITSVSGSTGADGTVILSPRVPLVPDRTVAVSMTLGSNSLSAITSVHSTSITLTTVSVGAAHTCGLSNEGYAYCWGNNKSGLLGIDSTADYVTQPVPVATDQQFLRVSAGGSWTCALTAEGAPWCWTIPNYTFTLTSTAPSPVPTTLRFAQISAGDHHACGLTASGMAYCWGSGAYGETGSYLNTTPEHLNVVSTSLEFTSISASMWHTCGVATSGGVFCWGWNKFGGLGVTLGPDVTDCTTLPGRCTGVPQLVALPAAGKAVGSGWFHSCALLTDGSVYCWGENDHGQDGNGSVTDSSPPARAGTGPPFSQLAIGFDNSCALDASGHPYCWGESIPFIGGPEEFCPSLSVPGASENCAVSPVPLWFGQPFRSLSVYQNTLCGMDTSGVVWCWGTNNVGQMGDGTTTSNTAPSIVFGQSSGTLSKRGDARVVPRVRPK